MPLDLSVTEYRKELSLEILVLILCIVLYWSYNDLADFTLT